jgi:hypothetical protein
VDFFQVLRRKLLIREDVQTLTDLGPPGPLVLLESSVERSEVFTAVVAREEIFAVVSVCSDRMKQTDSSKPWMIQRVTRCTTGI